MSKLGLSNNQRHTCFKGKRAVKESSWFDKAAAMKKPWERFDDSYTRLYKLVEDLKGGEGV